jgi:signal transduction histidine kinase
MINHIKEFYGSVIDLVGFIVGHTSDHGADIAIRALPILSPMPNAIGMYYVSITVLNFGHWQALAFALAIEFALFGLFEVALMMFDGTQTDEHRYRWPFRLAVTVAIIVMALIIIVVFRLETAHPILAVLPLFSAAGAVALALRRWHARNMTTKATAIETIEAALADAEDAATQLQAERSAMQRQIADQAKALADMERQLAVMATTPQPIETPTASIEIATVAMEAYQMQQEGMTVAQIAEALQKSQRTISNYLRDAKAALPTIAPVHTNGYHKQEA